eukprot:2446907-Prymnesium_polylepis.1
MIDAHRAPHGSRAWAPMGRTLHQVGPPPVCVPFRAAAGRRTGGTNGNPGRRATLLSLLFWAESWHTAADRIRPCSTGIRAGMHVWMLPPLGIDTLMSRRHDTLSLSPSRSVATRAHERREDCALLPRIMDHACFPHH